MTELPINEKPRGLLWLLQLADALLITWCLRRIAEPSALMTALAGWAGYWLHELVDRRCHHVPLYFFDGRDRVFVDEAGEPEYVLEGRALARIDGDFVEIMPSGPVWHTVPLGRYRIAGFDALRQSVLVYR